MPYRDREAEALYQTYRSSTVTARQTRRCRRLTSPEHNQKHQAMLAGVPQMIDEVLHERLDVLSLIRYVDYWFERHILDEDKHLAEALAHS